VTEQFKPNGVITLTTDFGHKGPFVAAMKGVMLGSFSAANVIDISHETSVHFPAEAGFWLKRSFRYFPAGSTHVAVVDPGVGTQRDILVGVVEGHAFVAPDNGLLASLLSTADKPVIHLLDLEGCASKAGIHLDSISATFHGRDIFAPLGAAIASGQLAPDEVGPRAQGIVPSWVEEPRVRNGIVRGVIVAVDNFGNLISNIDGTHVAGLEQVLVKAAGRSFELRRTYGDVKPGTHLALVNSFGVIEIARSERSAAESLGLSRGAPVEVHLG
jgi:S-adenosyl-L-methionine hydrolase (adenosine-forming)